MGQWHAADVKLGCFYSRPLHSTRWHLHGFFTMYVVVVGFVMYGADLHTILLMFVNRRQITRLGDMHT